MVKRKHSGGCTLEPLEARRMLSAAGMVISSSQPASWSDYAGSTIGGNFSGSWWQGSAGGGTVSLVVGIHNSQGQWVSGTSPYTLMQDNPPVNSPGDGWQLQFSGVDIPATPGNYTLVAAMENTAGNTTAETDFQNNVYMTQAVVGNVTALACNPGLTIGNVSQTTWSTAISSTISGSFNASMWNGTTSPNNAESLVVGIRNAGGQWVGATEPQDLYDVVPLVGPPGQSQAITFSGLEVPTTAGTYQVVAAEEPFTDALLAFEASADLGTATMGTVTVTPSSTVWGPLLQMPSWNQSGDVVYGSSVTFNQDCPLDPVASGNRSVSGCVATAEAQLAYYWRSMQSLSFSSADAYVSGNGTASQVSIDADSTLDDFPDFATLNSSLADITYDGRPSEMAMLEFGLGVKAQADFAYAGTSASVTVPVLNNLGYASAGWSTNWAAIEPTVIANIQAGEPVLLQVPDHLCLIDGYNQTNHTFHLVLGWGGLDDGWYSLPYYGDFAGTTTSGVVQGVGYDLVPATPLAVSLAFTSVPASASAAGFSVSVTLKDATGAVATGDTSSVTLAIAGGPGGAVLGGNLTVAAVNGVATFTNLTLNEAGTYTLSTADAADSLSGYVSGNIAVTPAHATPVFGNLSASATIAQGTAAVTFGGTIAAGTLIPPTTEFVAITLNGVTQDAAIGAQGNFSTSFNTSALLGSPTPYQVTYAYAGDANFNAVSNTTTTRLTVYSVLVTPAGNQSATAGQSQAFTLGRFATGANAVAPLSVDVNWGDATTDTIIGNLTTAGNITAQSHAYASSGNYTVTATVTDSNHHTSSATFGVTVGAVPDVSIAGSVGYGTNGNVTGLSDVMVYLDTNNNGALDAGETCLYTDANGNYVFSNLPAGHYTVRDVPPGGYVQTSPVTGYLNVTLTAGQTVTAQNFLDVPTGNATQLAVYRLYSPVTLEHLYTTDPREYNTLESYVGTWNGEGEVFSEYSGPATVGGITDEPLYRLYNPAVLQHLWTTDFNEYSVLATEGWNQENIVGYVFPAAGSTATALPTVPNSQALYRLMAPQVHLWTTSLNEYDILQTEGWTGEGIIGYVV